MDKRNNLLIKTKYEDLESAKSCIDIIGRSKFFVNGSGKFYGEFRDNTITITSNGKYLGAFEFVGEFIEEDGIYMKGNIRKRADIMKRYKLLFLFAYALAIVMLLSFNLVFMVMAVLTFLIPLINMSIVDKSNAFYNALIKRVSK